MKNEKLGLTLAENGRTAYTITLPRGAALVVHHAAQELGRWLGEITGARFPIAYDDGEARPVIAIGDSLLARAEGEKIDCSALGEEGYTLLTAGENLLIAAGGGRGCLYGVYGLLEDYLGCRFFTEDVYRIPKREILRLPVLHETKVPALEYRDPYFQGYCDGDFHVRMKSNSNTAHLYEEHGFRMEYHHFVHTFNSLVPPETYFAEHPEYFSLVDGKRLGERTQLCLTNPDVLRIAVAQVREWIRERPHARIISVSQNDWYNYCTCEKCRAVDEAEGSHAGTLLRFVNAIAEDIAKDYQDVIIDTLAYQYTRTAPKLTKPRENVCVRLCSIECCFAHPLEECGKNCDYWSDKAKLGSFVDDLGDWAKICDRLYIWDYVVNFAHTLQPFPNLYVLQPNIRFFIKNHVRGIFEEGNNSTRESGELNALRQYLVGKLLWDPDFDVERGIDEFLEAYYGMAAPEVRAFIRLIHEQITPDTHMWLFDSPNAPYLTDTMLDAAETLFDRAERIADNEMILLRVRRLRLSVRYVQMARLCVDAPDREEKLEDFFAEVRACGITSYREGKGLEYTEKLLREGPLVK
ncbi:MAG: DUF4838 domain-containing protein [Clostridiaceae bacterium]|nr:DUF4838 domain-containing protein [Clostridiaceae bacterium]